METLLELMSFKFVWLKARVSGKFDLKKDSEPMKEGGKPQGKAKL